MAMKERMTLFIAILVVAGLWSARGCIHAAHRNAAEPSPEIESEARISTSAEDQTSTGGAQEQELLKRIRIIQISKNILSARGLKEQDPVLQRLSLRLTEAERDLRSLEEGARLRRERPVAAATTTVAAAPSAKASPTERMPEPTSPTLPAFQPRIEDWRYRLALPSKPSEKGTQAPVSKESPENP